MQMDDKRMKKCSTSLAIREMQIKITVRFHFISIRMVIIKKTANNKCWKGCEEIGILIHCIPIHWECKTVQPL